MMIEPLEQVTERAVTLAPPGDAMNCDLIAPWYASVEHLCFGSALEDRRTAFLGLVGDARRALSCGEGDGRFLAALLLSNPHIEATSLDASRKMTELARQRVNRMGEKFSPRADCRFTQFAAFRPSRHSYDLIATNFFFDCFPTAEVHEIVERIAGWAAPQARWIVSEFAQPAEGVGHAWTGAVIRGLYAAFQVTTGLRTTHLPDYRPALAAGGFELRQEQHACGGLLVSELWERD
jgi:ubiquinone/menaquinone biosynthesis C-methylase UbiE